MAFQIWSERRKSSPMMRANCCLLNTQGWLLSIPHDIRRKTACDSFYDVAFNFFFMCKSWIHRFLKSRGEKKKKAFTTLTIENLLAANKWIKQLPSGCRRCQHSSQMGKSSHCYQEFQPRQSSFLEQPHPFIWDSREKALILPSALPRTYFKREDGKKV